MANIRPFQPYRFSEAAGPLDRLVTQPYDKISPQMQARYLALSPHNLVRVLLGERFASDDDSDNVYTRASGYLNDWIRDGILVQEREPSLYAYFQEFSLPGCDGGDDKFVRKGLIGLGAVQPYSDKVVHRHEQTLSGPKKDRTELLRHTRAHLGQLFMLYPDPELAVDGALDEAARGEPLQVVNDEYGAIHRVWKISDPGQISKIQQLMADKKLLIADGHHRYETALAAGDPFVTMTFVNMYSPGLKVLATHRVVAGLEATDVTFENTRTLPSLDELKQIFSTPAPEKVRIGIALPGELRLYERDRRAGELDVKILHEELLGGALGIGEAAVRDEKFLRYERGLDAAYGKVASGEAQMAFLLEPASVRQVADVAFAGGVMPQKSTDFFPKLLSGLTIYKVEPIGCSVERD